MIDLAMARALHVLGLIHWIGGVFLVTAVLLPAVRRIAEPERRIGWFEAMEAPFSRQAKFSVSLVGLTGFYMTYRLHAWARFLDPGFWWMHAMVLVWLLFTLVLFVAEPWFLHAWFRRHAQADPDGTFARIQRFHWILLTASLLAIAGAVLGTHGGAFWL